MGVSGALCPAVRRCFYVAPFSSPFFLVGHGHGSHPGADRPRVGQQWTMASSPVLLALSALVPIAAGLACPPNSAFVANASVCVDLYEAALLVGGKVWDPCANVDALTPGAYSAFPAKGISYAR